MSAETLITSEEPAPGSSIRPHAISQQARGAASAQVDPAFPDALLGTLLDGKYRIERKIGEGAMGVVLAATHLALEERVAIKIMRPEVKGVERTLDRFALEAKTAARIRSEHVAKVLDVGELEPFGPYIVMEYLEGKSLAELLEARLSHQQGPLSGERVVEYLLQACEALAAAHAIGIVHRDVKPENLFVTRHNGLEVVKLLDFGISRTTLPAHPDADAGANTLSFVMGTPLYMSPEQLRCVPDLDGRTDVWSMGAVMYELLSGSPAFRAPSIAEICTGILEATPSPLPSGCSPALHAVVTRCLEKDRERRFQSVAELAAALLPLARDSARAHAGRSSSILRASMLDLNGAAAAGDGWARTKPRGFVVQSSALVAAATVLAISALGIAITVSKTRDAPASSATAEPSAPEPPRLSTGVDATLLGAAVSTPGSSSLARAPSTPGSELSRATPASATAPPERDLARPVAPPARARGAARSTLVASGARPAAAPGSGPALSAAPALAGPVSDGSLDPRPPTADATGRVGRLRLVEPRSKLRLVERVSVRPEPAPEAEGSEQ